MAFRGVFRSAVAQTARPHVVLPRRAASYRVTPNYTRFASPQGRPVRPSWRILGYLGVAAAGVYIVFQERVPETGRRRFIFVSDSMIMSMSKASEPELSAQFGQRFLADSDPLAIRVRNIASRLLKAGGLAGPENTVRWRVKVINDPKERNAFVLPTGLICVFSGIVDVCDTDPDTGRRTQNDDALAAILGHEISHQLARHAAERASRQIFFNAISAILAFSLGFDPGLGNLGTELFLNLPNSRTAESEADHMGLDLMVKACYDPQAAPVFWQRMQALEEQSGERPPQLMSTHPSPANRIRDLVKWTPDAMTKRPDSCGPLQGYSDAFFSSMR